MPGNCYHRDNLDTVINQQTTPHMRVTNSLTFGRMRLSHSLRFGLGWTSRMKRAITSPAQSSFPSSRSVGPRALPEQSSFPLDGTMKSAEQMLEEVEIICQLYVRSITGIYYLCMAACHIPYIDHVC